MHFMMYNSSVIGFSLWMQSIKTVSCIRQSFRKLNFTALAKQSGFRERKSRKISPLNFVVALVAMASKGALSLGKEARLIGFLANLEISRQAVHKCARKATAFMTLVLLKLLELKAYGPVGRDVPKCLSSFDRILIVDSTSIGLPEALAPFFPGASNQTGSKQAQLKIQAYYDLRNESFVDFSLSSFRKNDQAASKDILAVAQPNDLILRDLGYFVLDVFKQLDQRGCFFVSRLKTGTCLLAREGDEELDLRKLLRGQKLLDMPVRVGKKAKLPVRLIAVKLPQKVADKRRREHRKNRDNRLRYTCRTSFLLGFEIFITNLDQKNFSPKQILSFYGLRWRIEVLFKAFKQHLNLGQVKETTPYQVELLIYARLILITHLLNFVYGPLRHYSNTSLSSPLSILKFSYWFDLFAPYFFILSFIPKDQIIPRWLKQIPKHCTYEKRSRLDFLSCFYSLG